MPALVAPKAIGHVMPRSDPQLEACEGRRVTVRPSARGGVGVEGDGLTVTFEGAGVDGDGLTVTGKGGVGVETVRPSQDGFGRQP